MNKLQKLNYIKFNRFKQLDFRNSILIFLHLNYSNAITLQKFYDFCNNHKIFVINFKLNFIKKKINQSKIQLLMNGPSLVLLTQIKNLSTITKLEKKFNFFNVLTYFYKTFFIKKSFITKRFEILKKLSLKLSLPSNHIFLFFFKRLTSLIISVVMKPLFNIYFLLKSKCLH